VAKSEWLPARGKVPSFGGWFHSLPSPIAWNTCKAWRPCASIQAVSMRKTIALMNKFLVSKPLNLTSGPIRCRASGPACLLLLAGMVCAAASVMAATKRWGQIPCVDPTIGITQPTFSPSSVYEKPRWIWGTPSDVNKSLMFGRCFAVTHLPRKTIVYLAATGNIHLWVNSKAVFLESASHRASTASLQTYSINVTQYLRVGVNRIFFSAGSGNRTHGVMLSLDNRDHGWHTIVRTDKYWYWSQLPVAGKSPLADAATCVWRSAVALPPPRDLPPKLCPMRWHYLYHLYFQPQHATVISGAGAFSGLQSVPLRLTARDANALRPGYTGDSRLAPAKPIHLVIRPNDIKVHLLRTKNVIGWSILKMPGKSSAPGILLDFGQEVAGRIVLRGTGGDVIVGTGESAGEALDDPWGGVHLLQLHAHQIEATPYSAFRYAVLYFADGRKITLRRLSLDFTYYPVKYRGSFACSDPLLTNIWYTGAYTAHLCMQQQIWDAPKRDRALWIGDIQISGQTINHAFFDHYLMEKSMTMVRLEAQRVRPPNALPCAYVNNLPGYSGAWICALADFYNHTGSLAYLKSQHQLLLSMLRYMKKGFNKHDLFTNRWKARWNFVDWAPHLIGAPDTHAADVATDLFTCLGIQRAVYLLNVLGDKTNAARYAAWDRKIRQAAQKYLASPAGLYTNIRQVNAMAVISGVATAQQRRAIYRQILGPDCAAWKQVATPYYNNFVIFALSRLGHYRQALNFIRYYWGGMIRRGATTFWEKYDPSCPHKHAHRFLDNDGGGPSADLAWNYLISLCHGWSSGATNWLTDFVLGARPLRGGFRRVLISPHLIGLAWAKGTIPTPHGPIQIKLTAERLARVMNLRLPAGVQGLIDVKCATMTVDGRSIIAGNAAGNITQSRVVLTGGRHYVVRWKR